MTKIYQPILLLIGVFIGSHESIAQDSVRTTAAKYFNHFSTSMLVGESEELLTGGLTMTHGVQLRRWRLGLGVGVDGYRDWRVLPLSLSVSYDYAVLERSQLFFQVNGGHGFAWWVVDEEEGVIDVNEKGGLMFQTMLGYRIVKENLSATISIGHKVQHATYSYRISWWPQNLYTIDNEMNRFVLQLGIGFN